MKIFEILCLIKSNLKRHKLHIFYFFMLSLFAWVISILIPYIFGIFIDAILNFKSPTVRSKIVFFTKILLALTIIEIIIAYFKNVISSKIKTLIAFELNYDVIEHIKRLPLSFFQNLEAAYLSQRINVDCNNIINFILQNMFSMFINILTLIALTILIFTMNVKIGLFILCSIPVYIFSYIIFKKRIFEATYKFNETVNKVFSKMNEQFTNIKVIKVNSWHEIFSRRLKNSFDNCFKSFVDLAKVSALFSNSDLAMQRILNIILVFFGGIEIYNRRLSIGNLTIMNNYFLMLLASLSYMLNFGKQYQEAMVAYKRINDLMILKEEDDGEILLDSINEIELKNICFHYDENKRILNNFSYKFTKGNIYCISGRNGLGKSTLINLIIGLIPSFAGELTINGINRKDINMFYLRKQLIGVAEQEPVLIGDTIKNNLIMGVENDKTYNLEFWTNSIKINDWVKNQSNGLDSTISENSKNISGGEKQKLVLCRTFIKDAELVILDEPTSAIDSSSIEGLQKILKDMKKDKIIIIISHDNNFLNIGDFIIDLETEGCK